MNHEEMTTGSLSGEFPTPDIPEKLQQMILNLNATREFGFDNDFGSVKGTYSFRFWL